MTLDTLATKTEDTIKADATKAATEIKADIKADTKDAAKVEATVKGDADKVLTEAKSLDKSIDLLATNELAVTEGLFKRFIKRIKLIYARIAFFFVTNF